VFGLLEKFDAILKYKVLLKALIMYVITSVITQLILNCLIQLLGFGRYFYIPNLSQPEIIFPGIS
jgi:hypothetical protein